MALKARTAQSQGKHQMGTFWATMAQADALNRIANSLDRLCEFFGVYDNDEEPDEDGMRFGDVLVEAVLSAQEEIERIEKEKKAALEDKKD